MELKWAALASTVKKNKVEGQGGAVVNPKEAARQFMASWDHTAPPSPPRQAQRDNYEEVEMDLASDCEAVDSPGGIKFFMSRSCHNDIVIFLLSF